MSAASTCDCPCPDPVITEVPGSPGADGAAGSAGSDGINAYTVTTSNLTLPAVAGPVIAPVGVGVSSWAGVQQIIFISDGTEHAHFSVTSIPGSASFILQWLDYPGDSAGTAVIASGATVSPAGVIAEIAGAIPTPMVDNSTGTASDTIAAGVGVQTISLFITATSIANGDLLTNYVPGYRFKILSFDARCATPVTTNAKASNLNLEINTTDLTGGVIALSGTYAQGAAQAGSAVTGNNVGTAGQSISVEASSTTAFVEGAFWLLIRIQNMDEADAFASLADYVNDILAAIA